MHLLWANPTRGQKLDDIKLTIELRQEKLKTLFQKLEKQTQLQFAFNEKEVSAFGPVSIPKGRYSVRELLDLGLKNTPLQYKQLNRSVVIFRPQASTMPPSPTLLTDRIRIESLFRAVTGKVTDEKGEPLPGVSILVKGTQIGTSTDTKGQFSLDVPPGEGTLILSYIGYVAQEVAIGSRTYIEVKMAPDVVGLSEVVVIGYGAREKKDLTGAVSQITAEEITRQTAMSPEMAMQGRMAGVFVSNPGSNQTARPNIRIRGVGTLGFNDPLYVIDGIPITEGGAANPAARAQDQRSPINIFSMINPNDIESISVLKDASATAIYGVRASNGVILITTKRGRSGKPRIDFAASYGIQNINKRYDVLPMEEYVALTREAWTNNTAQVQPPALARFYDPANATYLGNSPQYTDDWVNSGLVRNAGIQDYSLTISGGNEGSNYSIGAGLSSQENAVYYSKFDRYSLTINSDHRIKDWLKLGESLRIVYSKNLNQGGNGLGSAFVAPWQPLYDPNNTNGLNGYAFPGRTIGGAFVAQGYGTGTFNNNLAIAQYNNDTRNLFRNMGSFYAELTPLKGLRLRGTYSVDYYTNVQELYQDAARGLFEATGQQGRPYPQGNIFRRRINENLNLVGEFLIGYTRSFKEHNFDLILNAMDQKVYWNNTQNAVDANSPVPSYDQRRIEEGWARESKALLYERTRSGLQGYMARLSYNYNSKYYLDATLRRDGSSKFGPGYKWGTFPSLAVAWRVSSEPFMQNATWLSDFKIRAGWGRIGNQEVRDYAFLANINVNPKVAFGSLPSSGVGNGTIYDAAVLANLPTPNLSWETVTTSNIGFDSELFQRKLTFTAEYYHRLTQGILQTVPVPLTVGALQNPVVNLAEVTNQGIEIQANYNQTFGDFSFNAGLNLTTVKNRVNTIFNGVPSGGSESRIQQGYPINFIWGYQTNGIFQTPQEVADYLATINDPGFTAQKAPGDVRFVDFSGAPKPDDAAGAFQSATPDGVINAFDQTYLGKTIPGYFYGLNLGGNWKNFDVYLNFRGTGDVQKVFRNGYESAGGGGGNFLVAYRNRWTPENPSTTLPRAIQGDPSGNNRFSDRFVHDAGFLRFQNFQLGYTVKGNLLAKSGLRSFRAYVSAANLFVISPFPDLDPEDITTPTIFTLGLNLGL
jgi:TonB-dependent starch-binding outer membrane protein SusC